ncbi:MAG: hypothetical protein IJ809_06320 [Clostridia bacterium]|nr:hypothetical protein [Clostridia bacterium]
MSKLIDLFVEEYDSKGEIVFATWVRGIKSGSCFYGKQCSCSDLLTDEEVLVVPLSSLVKNAEGDFSFISRGDPKNDERLFCMKFSDLSDKAKALLA